MQRILEPEVMDTGQEAAEYDAMDFSVVNNAFAIEAIALAPAGGVMLDAGTGTARIPILIAQFAPQWQIQGIDLAENMLQIGRRNVAQAGLQSNISLNCLDSKNLPYPEAHFDMGISNSLVHHLPDPLPFWRELQRLLKPTAAILIRDLLRPATEAKVQELVSAVGSKYSDRQTQLFADSLRAALTLEEVKQQIQAVELSEVTVYQSSDLHWTVKRAAPEPTKIR
jgi:ubiquinone/menaquinone biosynthesis C-methylase UbiE